MFSLVTQNKATAVDIELIGWADDGFPIYALYGYQDGNVANSEIVSMTSSYRLKSGQRPGGNEPDGEYDGTFVRDYEYVEGVGSLDECNGRMTITPEFPDGTDAYFLTQIFQLSQDALKAYLRRISQKEDLLASFNRAKMFSKV